MRKCLFLVLLEGEGENELASCPSKGSDIVYKFSSGFQTVTQTIFMWKIFPGFENILLVLAVYPLLNKNSDRNYQMPYPPYHAW